MTRKKTVHTEDTPRWHRLIEWVRDSYDRRIVEVCEDGEPIAYIVGPAFARAAATLAELWHNREKPYTQETLDAWLAAQIDAWDADDLAALAEGDLSDD